MRAVSAAAAAAAVVQHAPKRHGQPRRQHNERTKNDMGLIIPVVITVYADRSFTFITKTPPAAVLIKKECNIESGSGVPNKEKVATISKASVQKIAEMKMRDLNAASLEAFHRRAPDGL